MQQKRYSVYYKVTYTILTSLKSAGFKARVLRGTSHLSKIETGANFWEEQTCVESELLEYPGRK